MRFRKPNGKYCYINCNKYRINWNGPSKSNFQFKVKQFFRRYWKNHIVFEEFPLIGTRLRCDFLNATKQIAVEAQGEQHHKFNRFFHRNSRNEYLKTWNRDERKRELLELNEYILIEITSKDLNNLSLEYLEKKFSISIT